MTVRCLIIEDNPVNLELMNVVLQAYGFETLSATGGAAGIELARSEQPDLILCNVQMPGIDGFDVVRALEQDARLRAIPVLALTAYAMVGDRERLLAAGFDGYIAKPIDTTTIAATIHAFLPDPMRRCSPLVEPTPAAAPVTPSTGAATILVLDDTPANLELKHALLEPHGYTVLTASTLAQALALARCTQLDLIISDVGMRDGNGFDAILAVKADPQLRDVPFMFLSSTHWDEESRVRGLSLGAVRYLERPLAPELLLAEIRACLSAGLVG